jgi:hypothetical protein
MQIATSIVDRFRDEADEGSRAFACELLNHCRLAIEDVLEPVDDDVFAAFVGERTRWREVSPVPDGDPGSSNHAPTKRARHSALASR